MTCSARAGGGQDPRASPKATGRSGSSFMAPTPSRSVLGETRQLLRVLLPVLFPVLLLARPHLRAGQQRLNDSQHRDDGAGTTGAGTGSRRCPQGRPGRGWGRGQRAPWAAIPPPVPYLSQATSHPVGPGAAPITPLPPRAAPLPTAGARSQARPRPRPPVPLYSAIGPPPAGASRIGRAAAQSISAGSGMRRWAFRCAVSLGSGVARSAHR